VTYYAVFDGHGGAECAKFLRDHLHIELKKSLLDQIDGIKDSEDLNESLIRCIENTFESTDLMYKKAFPDACNFCGATAVVCLILGNKLVCANVGDARAIICRNGKAVDLSVDHKAVSNLDFFIFIVKRRRARENQETGRIYSLW
jgi:serine/threonine protein phosphatase PrpC